MLADIYARQGKQGRETELGTLRRTGKVSCSQLVLIQLVGDEQHLIAEHQPFSKCKLVSITRHLLMVSNNYGIHKVVKGFSEAYAVIDVLFQDLRFRHVCSNKPAGLYVRMHDHQIISKQGSQISELRKDLFRFKYRWPSRRS